MRCKKKAPLKISLLTKQRTNKGSWYDKIKRGDKKIRSKYHMITCDSQHISGIHAFDGSARETWRLLRMVEYEEQAGGYLAQKAGKKKKRTKVLKWKPKRPHRRASRTGPDTVRLTRANKPHGMHYLSHQAFDTDHGIILDAAVTAGDACDKAPYLAQVDPLEFQQALRYPYIHIRSRT